MVPASMVFAALGLMLSFVPRRTAVACIALAIVLALAASRLQFGAITNNVEKLLCWAVIMVLAIVTYWPARMAFLITAAIAAAAGLVAGTAIPAAGPLSTIWQPILAVSVILPAAFTIERGYAVAPRVVVSWLVAVSVLAALLPYVVAHPGYVPDHRG